MYYNLPKKTTEINGKLLCRKLICILHIIMCVIMLLNVQLFIYMYVTSCSTSGAIELVKNSNFEFDSFIV